MFEAYASGRLPESPFFERDTDRRGFIAQSSSLEWFYVTREYLQDRDLAFSRCQRLSSQAAR